MTWASDELDRIGAAEELDLTPKKRRGVTVWVVRHGDDLYVRSVYGRGSGWFRGVQDSHEGHVSSGGVEKNVRFVEIDDDALIDAVGDAYRTKYADQPAAFVDPLLTPEARAATLRLEPQS